MANLKETLKPKDVDPALLKRLEDKYGPVNMERDFFTDNLDTYFKTDEINPETGSVSHKVIKLASFGDSLKKMADAVKALKGLMGTDDGRKDSRIRDIADDLKLVFNKYRTHLRKNYPDQYNQIKDTLEEISTSGAAGSYLTPYAFRLKGSKPNDKAYKELGYKEVKEAMDGGTLLDYFNTKYVVDDHFHSDDSYIVKREPSGKDQYVIFDYNKDNDQFQIRQMGGYQIDQKEAIKAGMREAGRSGVVGIDSYMVDGNYSPTPISAKGLKDIVDHVMGGLSREAKAQQDFYARRGPTSGTVDEGVGASLGPGPKASEDGVKDNAYVRQFGYKLVPKKIKGSGLEVKQLFEKEDAGDFQKKRIEAFDRIEQEMNDIYKMLSNAKNETSDYYNENPGSFSVVKPTDLVLDYIKDIKDLLKGE